MSDITIDDFDQRWADWQAKGRRHESTLQRRMQWLVWPIGTILLVAAVRALWW